MADLFEHPAYDPAAGHRMGVEDQLVSHLASLARSNPSTQQGPRRDSLCAELGGIGIKIAHVAHAIHISNSWVVGSFECGI
jgi:hypothetical protein